MNHYKGWRNLAQLTSSLLGAKTPRRGRRDTSAERDLTKVREAHWRALATVATLEEEIVTELVHHPRLARHPCPLQSWDCHRRRSWGWNRRCCRVWPEEGPGPFFKYSPPQRGSGSGEDEEAEPPLLDFDLEAPLELGPEVDHFLQESAGSLEEEDRNRSSPEHLVEEYERWVTWRAWAHDTPGWWQELAKVPKIDDHQELALEGVAFFKLPWQISEQHGVENYYQASPALPCICWKGFLPLPDPKFACQDIRESQLEKMVCLCPSPPVLGGESQSAYPGWNMPFGGECIGVEGGDETLHLLPWWSHLQWHGPPRGTLNHTIRGSHSPRAPNQCRPTPLLKRPLWRLWKNPTKREQPPNRFPGWREVLHPSRPVVAAGQIPPISQGSKQRPLSQSSGKRMVQHQWADELKVQSTKSKPTSLTKALEIAQWVTLPPGFLGATACLQRDPSPEKACEVSPGPRKNSRSDGGHHGDNECKDEVTGVTYMDTVTTSMGQVALSGPEKGTPTKGPIIEDITDLLWWTNLWLPLGGRVSQWLPLGRKIEMPLGGNHNQNLIISFSYTAQWLLVFTDWTGPCSPSPCCVFKQ